MPAIPYLHRRPDGRYCARRRVPDCLQSVVGRKELRRSLNTRHHRTALGRLPAALAAFDAVLTRAEAEAFAQRSVAVALEDDLQQRERGAVLDSDLAALTVGEVREELTSGNYASASRWLDGQPEYEELDADDRQRIVFALARLLPRFFDTLAARSQGHFTDAAGPLPAAGRPAPAAQQPSAAPATPHTSTRTLLDVHAQWKREANPAAKTADGYLATVRRFNEAQGHDVPLHALDRDAVVRFRTWLTSESGLAPKTQADRWSHIITLLRFGVSSGLLAHNPSQDLRLAAPKQTDDDATAKSWPVESLPLYFRSDLYIANGTRLPLTTARQVVPLLAILTGARREELCGLDVTDVDVDDNGVVLHVRANAHRTLKNTASRRTIPLPPVVDSLGVVEFLHTRRSAGTARVFHEISGNNKYGRLGDGIGKWQARQRKRLALPAVCTLHALRHSYIHLTRQHIEDADVRRALVGHAQPDVHGSVYGDGVPLERLRAEVAKLDFGFLL